MRVTPGFAAAILIAVLVALFPFYADALTPLIWSQAPTGTEEHGAGGAATEIWSGVVKSVEPQEGLIVLSDGREVRLRGYWVLENAGGKEVDYTQLASMIKPGEEIRVACRVSQRWGCMAEELWSDGIHAVRLEGGE